MIPEKLLFIEITNKIKGKLPDSNSDYFSLVKSIEGTNDYDRFIELAIEVNEIYFTLYVMEDIDDVFVYNDKIKKVSAEILALCEDFNISMKEEPMSEYTKNAIITILGKDFYDRTFGK